MLGSLLRAFGRLDHNGDRRFDRLVEPRPGFRHFGQIGWRRPHRPAGRTRRRPSRHLSFRPVA